MLWLANGGSTYAALTTRFFLDINTLYKPAFFFFYLGKDASTHSSIKDALDRGNRVPTWIYKDARTWTVRLRYIQLPTQRAGRY